MKTRMTTKVPDTTPNSGCSADSFMIDDGVCDELTNVERCLFDGGDCCRQNKTSTLCKVCTCKIKFDDSELTQDLKKHNTNLVKNPVPYISSSVISEEKLIEDVQSKDTCSVLCLEKELENRVNSWVFHISNKTCICLWIENTFCESEDSLVPVNSQQSLQWQVFLYVQLDKLIACGELNNQ